MPDCGIVATQGVTVERMVFLQCECDVSQFQDEADWVAGLAQADPAFCLQPGFVEGVRLLQDYGLHFELCLKGDEQFRNALELVRRCPGVRFVLDHIGKPSIKEQRLEPWAGHLRELAALPDTWCKVSGLVSEADWQGWRISRPEERRRLFHDNAVRAYRLSD